MSRRVLAVAVAAAVVLVGALTAIAGDVTGKDAAGDVHAKGLTRAERNALDIVSVRVLGEEGRGVIVVVTFKGKFGQAVGHGHLKRAGAAMILVPKTSGQTTAGLVTVGAGQGKTYRATASQQVGAARGGNQLVFVIVGPGFDNVGAVRVKTFAKMPPLHVRAAAIASTPPKLDDPSWSGVYLGPSADSSGVVPVGGSLFCTARDAVPPQVRSEGITELVGVLLEQCVQPQPQVTGNFFWTFSGSENEAMFSGMFTGPPGASFNGIRVVLPPGGELTRGVTNWLPPPGLTAVVVSRTVTPNDTITFSAPTSDALLLVDEPTQFNVRFSGPPATATTVFQVFGSTNGQFLGPLNVPVGK